MSKRIYLVNDETGGHAYTNNEFMADAVMVNFLGYRRVTRQEYERARCLTHAAPDRLPAAQDERIRKSAAGEP